MRNKKIESIFEQQEAIRNEFGPSSQEMKDHYNSFTAGAWVVMSAYRRSKIKGFDEIVFEADDIIWENSAAEVVAFCKEAKVGWFVYGSRFSGAFESVMSLVKAGARAGAFVVKTYTEEKFGGEELVEIPGIRINI